MEFQKDALFHRANFGSNIEYICSLKLERPFWPCSRWSFNPVFYWVLAECMKRILWLSDFHLEFQHCSFEKLWLMKEFIHNSSKKSLCNNLWQNSSWIVHRLQVGLYREVKMSSASAYEICEAASTVTQISPTEVDKSVPHFPQKFRSRIIIKR